MPFTNEQLIINNEVFRMSLEFYVELCFSICQNFSSIKKKLYKKRENENFELVIYCFWITIYFL